jgi:hypothetical protein
MDLTWATHRSRTACAKAQAAKIIRAEIVAAKSRVGGQFVKETKRDGPSVRTPAERAEKREEVLQSKFDKYIVETRNQIAELKAQHANALYVVKRQLEIRSKEVVALKVKLRLARPSLTTTTTARPLLGGNSAPTQRRIAAELGNFLEHKFATAEARKQALYEHFQRNPHMYTAIIAHGITLAGFHSVCRQNPEWVNPIRREVIEKIEEFWTLEKCLSIQIHSKVGHAEKYQHLINISAKDYCETKKEWVHKELFERGSGVFLPRFKSKNAVTGLRDAIVATNPLLQDEAGTACWLDLNLLIEETLRDERLKGYLQSAEAVESLRVWLHWGGDAAGWLRGLKHSKWGYKVVGMGRVCSQSPSNMRTVLLFEGKDNYVNYKEYMHPFLPVMDSLKRDGIRVDDIHYTVKQSMGADYVLMAEVLGHGGHSCTQGCCLCDIHKKDYGTIVTNTEGRRVPLGGQPRTLEQMAAATHRPLRTGPDVKCPYCDEVFPDQAAVDNSRGPETETEKTAYQLKHAGMRFGCPPLFNFEVVLLYLCILHTLLRLIAVVFKRTIVANLDTAEKVDAVNKFIKEAKLGCKKVAMRKKDGKKKKDTEDINFIGR